MMYSVARWEMWGGWLADTTTTMPETIRVGIIGSGTIAQDRHIPLLQKVPDVRITHAWSRRPETARQAAHRL